MIATLATFVEHSLDRVTDSYRDLSEAISPSSHIMIFENADGSWDDGRSDWRRNASRHAPHISVALDPRHFLIVTLPLPLGAKPYLNAVIAAQIDRISPWPQERAIFGARIAEENANSLTVRVAIAARDQIHNFLQSLDLRQARSVTLDVVAPEDDAEQAIRIPFATGARQRAQQDRRLITAIGFGAIACALLAEAASIGFGYEMQASLATTRKEIAALRETLGGLAPSGDLKADPFARMAQLKSATVPTVVILDEMAKILPDHTYLTAFETEPGKLHLEGVSTAATDLPKAISNQSIFGDATFSAPTVKRRDIAGETFQLDIVVKPREAKAP